MVAPFARPLRRGSGGPGECLPDAAQPPPLAVTFSAASAAAASCTPSISRLYKAPEWHDFGALRGFRVNFSTADAFLSMLTVHQDTVNIWSHLLGLFYFVAAVPEAWRALDAGSAPALLYACFAAFLLCAQVQMLTSVLYHTLRCVTRETSATFLYLDFVGIVCMIAGAYTVGMTLGFYCSPATVLGYLGATGSMLALTMYAVSCALKSGQWGTVYLSMFVVVAFGLCPCLHLYFLHSDGVFGVDSAREFLQRAFWGLGGNYFLGA
jgi:predicted membrane channel-forming protein YqfA (hemolysin III family)